MAAAHKFRVIETSENTSLDMATYQSPLKSVHALGTHKHRSKNNFNVFKEPRNS